MRCLIVDDDPAANVSLRELMQKVPFLELVKTCSSCTEALQIMLSDKIDIIFLGLDMREMDGLDFLKAFDETLPQVIIMTSESKYALNAFNYNVTAFLLKPIKYSRFAKAVIKASQFHEKKFSYENSDWDVFLKSGGSYVKVNTKDILYIEALENYVTIHTPLKDYHVHNTMKNMEKEFPVSTFMRVHNSYIIRLDKISKIEDNSVIMNNQVIPVSRSCKKLLMDKLKFV